MGIPSVLNMLYYYHRAPHRCGPYSVPSKTFVLAMISEISYIYIPLYIGIHSYIPFSILHVQKEGNIHTRELSIAICTNCLFITPPEIPFSF